MKVSSMRLALPTAILAIVFSAPGRAEEAVKADFSTASPSGEDRILQNVSRGVGARFSWIYSHPTARGTTNGVSREPVTGLYRAQAGK